MKCGWLKQQMQSPAKVRTWGNVDEKKRISDRGHYNKGAAATNGVKVMNRHMTLRHNATINLLVNLPVPML